MASKFISQISSPSRQRTRGLGTSPREKHSALAGARRRRPSPSHGHVRRCRAPPRRRDRCPPPHRLAPSAPPLGSIGDLYTFVGLRALNCAAPCSPAWLPSVEISHGLYSSHQCSAHSSVRLGDGCAAPDETNDWFARGLRSTDGWRRWDPRALNSGDADASGRPGPGAALL